MVYVIQITLEQQDQEGTMELQFHPDPAATKAVYKPV
jgi:hypothetical protein